MPKTVLASKVLVQRSVLEGSTDCEPLVADGSHQDVTWIIIWCEKEQEKIGRISSLLLENSGLEDYI